MEWKRSVGHTIRLPYVLLTNLEDVMSSSITFYPVGNADTTLIELDSGKKFLIDFAHSKSSEECGDKKVNLDCELRRKLDPRNPCLDVVAFTHADEDHTRGAADFFELEHVDKYRGNGRVKIKELWVPAAMIVEGGLHGDDRAIRQEARHRLKQRHGVKVFSSPVLLDKWLEENGIPKQEVEHLLADAGNAVSVGGELEAFVHSPFAFRNGGSLQPRNDSSLVLHLTFGIGNDKTTVMMGADITHDVLEAIIKITKLHGRYDRLKWDIFRVSHHCSYKSLSSEKGYTCTEPSSSVDWLFGQGNSRCYIVSSSDPIPHDDSSDQPPHRQAAKYYEAKAQSKGGQFLVTMEHPSKHSPEPIVFEIGMYGVTLKKVIATGSQTITRNTSPKMG